MFGVDETTTKARLDEGLDLVLSAWTGRPFAAAGEHFEFPEIRTWPEPVHPPGEVLLMSVGGTTPVEESVARGLPLAYASPFAPVEATATMFRHYAHLVEESPLDTDLVLDRAMVLLYTLLAPTTDEAHAIARKPYEWHMARLAALSGPARPEEWPSLTGDTAPRRSPTPSGSARPPPTCSSTTPTASAPSSRSCAAAGVRNVVCWMGVGGVAEEHVLRSMRLFADEVRPRFAD